MFKKRLLTSLAFLLILGCGADESSDRSPSGDTSAQDGGADGDGDTDSDADSDSDGDEDDDAGPDTDTYPEYTGPAIPETCEQAEQATTTVGCLFYAVDLDSGTNSPGFAVAISNVNKQDPANILIFKHESSGWEIIEQETISSMDLITFKLPNLHLSTSGLKARGSYRIESDIPIIVYQFNPLNNPANPLENWSSDASLLIPATSLSSTYEVISWKRIQAETSAYSDYFTVVALNDGTEVTITPAAIPASGSIVQSSTNPFVAQLNEGDALEVATRDVGSSMTGSRVESDEDHPVAVFTGHQCAHVPANVTSCDHMEEQMPGLRFWGSEIVAARMPTRTQTGVDPVMWQIYASEDFTEIKLSATFGVKGLPASPLFLNAGDAREFQVTGTKEAPGDFFIQADKPIGVMQYMTGSRSPNAGLSCDPSMVYVPPVEQSLPRYVVLVPKTWEHDVLVITREAGKKVILDGEEVLDSEFTQVADSGYEVARITVEDGVHALESGNETDGLGVMVVGWAFADSYAYIGGMGLYSINPAVL